MSPPAISTIFQYSPFTEGVSFIQLPRTLSVFNAYYSLVDKMTPQPSILAGTMDKKTPNLYYFSFFRTLLRHLCTRWDFFCHFNFFLLFGKVSPKKLKFCQLIGLPKRTQTKRLYLYSIYYCSVSGLVKYQQE